MAFYVNIVKLFLIYKNFKIAKFVNKSKTYFIPFRSENNVPVAKQTE